MAAIHGKNTYFLWNSVQLSNFGNDVSFPQTIDTAETSVFALTSKTYVVGLKDTTISISGVWEAGSSTVDATLGGALGTSAAFEFRANDGSVSTTNPKYTGTAFLTSYEVDGSIGDAVTWSAEFQVTGNVTRATS